MHCYALERWSSGSEARPAGHDDRDGLVLVGLLCSAAFGSPAPVAADVFAFQAWAARWDRDHAEAAVVLGQHGVTVRHHT